MAHNSETYMNYVDQSTESTCSTFHALSSTLHQRNRNIKVA